MNHPQANQNQEPAPASSKAMSGQHRKNIVNLIRANANRKNLWDVFSDFVEMSAISISNSIDLRFYDVREKRYMDIVRRYEPQEVARFPEMFASLALALEEEPCDVIGPIFEELGLANSDRGQFFTPWAITRLLAKVQIGDGAQMRALIAENGFVTATDPAGGSGAGMIAFAYEMQDAGFNYQEHLHVTAQDIDPRAVHMAYLQLSLLNIPAVVILGNSLALEEREHWCTPAHVMGFWAQKLRRGYALGSAADRGEQIEPAEAVAEAEAYELVPDVPAALYKGFKAGEQFALF